MSLTAEENAALAADELSTDDATTIHDTSEAGDTPAPEQPAPDASAAAGGENEAGSDKTEGEQPEAEKKPEQPSHWRAVEAAKKAQIKVAKDREALDREKTRVTQYEERLASHLETRTRELDARESKVKPLLEALERKDLQGLVALGFDFEKYARENIDANTPAGRARRAEERVEALEKKQREEAEQRQAHERKQSVIAANREDATNLVGLVEEHPEECPELYAWAPERVAHEGLSIRDALRRSGRKPTYELVLKELQTRARTEAGVAQTRTSGLQQKRSPQSSDAGSAGKADPNRTSAGGNPPALSSRTANERPPTPPREKTEAEIDAECLAELRGLSKR